MNQVILDTTGNSNTAINGLSLFTEPEDVIWTDRGGYFGRSSVVSLPPNSISSSSLAFKMDSSVTIWLMASESGMIFSKPDLSVEVFTKHVDLHLNSLTLSSLSTDSELLGKWLIFCLTFDQSLSEFQIFLNRAHVLTYAFPSKWIDQQGQFQLGGNFNGFLFNAIVYNGKISFEKFTTGYFSKENSFCFYPETEENCLSTVLDPGRNKHNLQCNCPQNVSCDDNVNHCKQSTHCDDYAHVAYPYTCQDIRTLCGEHQYIYSSRKCNFWCIENCVFCSDAKECQECAQGLTLLPDKTCGCENGYFLSSQTCLPCDISCNTCTDSEQCTSCYDPAAQIVNGLCVDLSNIDINKKECNENCKHCAEGDCIECHSGHDLVHFSCRKRILQCLNYSDDSCVECSDGFYLNSNSECTACSDGCSKCTSSDTCSSCADSKADLQSGTCVCNIPYSVMNNGSCECENGYIWSANLTSYCVLSFDLNLILTKENSIIVKVPEELESFTNTSYTFLIDQQFSIEASLRVKDELNYFINMTYSPSEIPGNVRLIILFNSTLTTITEKMINKTSYDFQLNSNIEKIEGLRRMDSMTYMIGGTLLMSFFSMLKLNDGTCLWALLNTYQFIAYLPVLALDFSEEVMDFLVSFQTARALPNLFSSFKSDIELPRRFQEYGEEVGEWGDTHSVKNTGRYILLVGILLCLWLVYILCGCLLPSKLFKESVDRNRKKWRGLMLRVWNCLNLDLMLCSSFVLFNVHNDSLVSLSWSYFLGIVNMTLLFLLFLAPKRMNLNEIEEDIHFSKFGTFTEELSNTSLWGSRYYFLFNIRKCVLSFSFYLFHDRPVIVLSSQISFSVLFCFYFLYFKVFNTYTRTLLYMMSELTIFTSYVCSLLINYMPDSSWNLGKIILSFNVGFFLCVSLLNIGNIIYSCFKNKRKDHRTRTLVMKIQPNIFASFDDNSRNLNHIVRENNNEIRNLPVFTMREQDIY